MNKGSAAKWVEALLTGNYAMNDGIGLRYNDNTFCVAGVLEDFVSGQCWTLEESLCSYVTAEGSPHRISKDTLTRCKIKTDFAEVYEFHRANPNKDAAFYAQWIEANYERF